MKKNTAIHLENVSKHFKLYKNPRERIGEFISFGKKKYHTKHFVLEGINLTVKSGEILGIVGKNGCGKSTLLKILVGVFQPSSGNVIVNGTVSALLELSAGFNPELTGIENIGFVSTISGVSRNKQKENFSKIVAFSELGDYLHQPVKSYSSGMKSRLGFAIAVNIDPEILILDEVLAVGDIQFRRKCYSKMEEFFRAGKTIIFVSHDSRSVNKLCSRAILLHDRKIIVDGSPSVVTNLYRKLMLDDSSTAESISLEYEKLEELSMGQTELNAVASASALNTNLPITANRKIEWGAGNATIRDIKILDQNRSKVTEMDFGFTYFIEFEVTFLEPAKNISIGVSIKDVSGVVITSIESVKLSAKGYHFDILAAGEVVYVSVSLRSQFCDGFYFVDAGVSSFAEGQEVMHRVADSLSFRARHVNSYSNGYVEMFNYLAVKDKDKTSIMSVGQK